MCPQEAPAALDMLDRHTVRRVTAAQSGRVLHQFFARPIVREEAALRPPAEAVDGADRSGTSTSSTASSSSGSTDDETLTQLVARAEEKALVPLEEHELPPVRAVCFAHDTCTCRAAAPDHLCVCCCRATLKTHTHVTLGATPHDTVQTHACRDARRHARPQPLPHAHRLGGALCPARHRLC